MKFFYGQWEKLEGVTVLSPKMIYEHQYENKQNNKNMTNCIKMLVPTEYIYGRGNTLDGVVLTVKITSPIEGVFAVEMYHYKGTKDLGPHFDIKDEMVQISFMESEEKIEVISGDAKLIIQKDGFIIELLYKNELKTTIGNGDLNYIRTGDKGLLYEEHNEASYMRGAVSLGLGERFGPFIKNGQSIDMWNEDGGTASELSYKNIPFFVSNKGYGVFVNHTEKVSFEIGTELVKKSSFSVPGESLKFCLIPGIDMKEVLSKYTELTGKPPILPEWSFGLWLSTSFTTDYDEATVMQFLNEMESKDIPVQVFHFDCFWMKGFHWTDFMWDEKVFPDPEGMLKRIKEKGIKICVWMNPYIAQESILFDEGMEKGYGINGRPEWL